MACKRCKATITHDSQLKDHGLNCTSPVHLAANPAQIVTAKVPPELAVKVNKMAMPYSCESWDDLNYQCQELRDQLKQAVELLREKCTTGFEIDDNDSFCPRCVKIKAFLERFDEAPGGTGT